MQIIIIGDKHIKISNLPQSIELLRWIEQQVVDIKPNLLVDLGDSFDNHAIIRSEVLTEFTKHIQEVTKTCPYIYVLGNHDMYKPTSSKYHALQSLNIPNLHVITKPQKKGNLSFIPFMPNPKDFPKELTGICFAHQTFIGADYGSIRSLDGVDTKIIQGVDLMISGHIHKKQQFDKVFYPGSPISSGIRDVDQVKGIHTLDTNTLKINFIQSPFPVWRVLEIDLGSFSREQVLASVVAMTNLKDRWIIKLIGNRKDIAAVISDRSFNDVKAERGLIVRTEYTDTEKMAVTIQATSLEKAMDVYMDKVYSGSIPANDLKVLIKEIMGS